ncbi:MAG: HAD-IA family hydrolase [Actinobacteria bacterium]|nr:HAD-IA family hydrolase [Actinomycetota bacterium]
MSAHLDVVFLDVGGPIYDDRVYYASLLRAIREEDPEVTPEAFDREYQACRVAQAGSFRRHIIPALLGPDAGVERIASNAERWWDYPPESLLPDVVPCLRALKAAGYRLAVLANQPARTRHTLARDGLDRFFDLYSISEELGFEKPDPRIFEHAVEQAGAEPARAVMVGDRLDNDVRPAKAAGMFGVWLLRGEAPDEPTSQQRAEADACIRTLEELPEALETLGAQPKGST